MARRCANRRRPSAMLPRKRPRMDGRMTPGDGEATVPFQVRRDRERDEQQPPHLPAGEEADGDCGRPDQAGQRVPSRERAGARPGCRGHDGRVGGGWGRLGGRGRRGRRSRPWRGQVVEEDIKISLDACGQRALQPLIEFVRVESAAGEVLAQAVGGAIAFPIADPQRGQGCGLLRGRACRRGIRTHGNSMQPVRPSTPWQLSPTEDAPRHDRGPEWPKDRNR